MSNKKKYYKCKGKGKITDVIKWTYKYAKKKLTNANNYLKEKQFIKNLISPTQDPDNFNLLNTFSRISGLQKQ